MDSKIEFAVFCIENVARQLHENPSAVYEALAHKSHLLTTYILPNYDVLHTQSMQYIVDDIIETMREAGLSA